mgnify:CR=1 FL=1
MKKLSSLLVFIFCLIPFLSDAWILRDEFTTNRAAGAIDDTAAEPTGTRDVATDTNSKLTIGSGLLTFATGGAAAGDPGLWYTQLTRVAGLTLIGEITPDGTTNASIGIGWDANQAGAQTNSLNLAADGYLQAVVNGGTAITVGSYTAASHKLGISLRATGAYYWAKLGADTSWELYWIGAADSGNNHPSYSALGTSAIATSSFIRIPNTLWLPSPLASDGFSVSGTTDGKGHAEGVAGGIGEGGGGLAWQSGGTTWSVSGGKAVNTPTVGDTSLWDAGADTFESGIYGWVKYGNNTVENDNGKLKITYVDHGYGAKNSLVEAGDLTEPLTIGQWYMFTADMMTAKTGQGDAFYISDGSTTINLAWVTSNTMTPYNISFRALSANGDFAYIGEMSAGDVFYIDNISLKPLTLSELVNTVQTSTQDVIATINTPTLQVTGVWGGVALNVDSATNPQNMVIGLTNTYRATLTKMVNGVWTEVISGKIKWVSNAELRVIKDGTTYRLYYNNLLVGTATISDESIINNTRHGLFSTDAANTLDNFTLYARGTGGEYTVLDGLMNYEVPFPGGNPPAGGLTLINAGN